MVKYEPSDIHEDITEAVPDTLPEDIGEYVTRMRSSLEAFNAKSGYLKTEKGKSGNVHPERLKVHKKGERVFITRSDEGRLALKAGGEVPTLEDLGFTS